MEIEVLVTNIEKNLRSVEKSFNVLSSENRDFNFMLTYSKKIKIKLRNAKKDALSLKTELKSDGDEETKKKLAKFQKTIPRYEADHKELEQKLAKMKDEGIEQVTNYAYDLQDKTLETLANTKEVLVRTDETAIDIAGSLERQTEQIRRLKDEAYEIDNLLERSAKLTKGMLLAVATNKKLWIMIGILVLVIVADILLAKLYKK